MDPYYEPQFEQAPVRKIAWKKIALIAGTVIAVVVIAGVVIRLMSGSNEAERRAQETVDFARRASANCENEKCVDVKVREIARVSGVVSACNLLEGDKKDNCIWTTARTNNNAEFCGLIEKKEWASQCKDGIIFVNAKEAGDSNACHDIKDERLREACTSELMGPVTSANCQLRGFDVTYCSNVALMEQARQKRDPDVCQQIQDEAQMENCLERTGPADRDRDGLSESEEERYGTSDTNADSDGDGFKDGEEVRAGYNPAGAGTL
ncbi:MAG: thrombospondin type 3 repeat-containing protein [Anaerolineales bacterium]|nr:thrombospondin type 3 repeat-containing protein [Anaerolineales bacterium]